MHNTSLTTLYRYRHSELKILHTPAYDKSDLYRGELSIKINRPVEAIVEKLYSLNYFGGRVCASAESEWLFAIDNWLKLILTPVDQECTAGRVINRYPLPSPLEMIRQGIMRIPSTSMHLFNQLDIFQSIEQCEKILQNALCASFSLDSLPYGGRADYKYLTFFDELDRMHLKFLKSLESD